jgi:hypothetical protein
MFIRCNATPELTALTAAYTETQQSIQDARAAVRDVKLRKNHWTTITDDGTAARRSLSPLCLANKCYSV